MDRFLFTPELALDPEGVPRCVAVKGQMPHQDYSFTLRDLYSTVPSLNPHQAYGQIRQELGRAADILERKIKVRHPMWLPPAENDIEALSLMGMLFDPDQNNTDMPWGETGILRAEQNGLFDVGTALPFPLRLASPEKLAHTLAWIDTNIKVSVESLLRPFNAPASDSEQIVESALRIYSYLIKQQDYWLARSISFNFSMFLQDRILNLIFGDEIGHAAERLLEQGGTANTIVMQLLKNLEPLSYRQLCTLCVFMGVIWSSREDIQQAFLAQPNTLLAEIGSQLNALQSNWCVDHIDQFLADIGADAPQPVAVILDDNGESVFDIALFQRLLNDTGHLRVIFVVNRYPVSNNIALETFQVLWRESYFADLKRHFEQGRAKLCIEDQPFRSFEPIYLQSQTRQALHRSRFTYIKGANFFETLQLPQLTRYHCFTIHGPTGVILTGGAENQGVFAKLGPGQMAYTYYSSVHIETLHDKITAKGIN